MLSIVKIHRSSYTSSWSLAKSAFCRTNTAFSLARSSLFLSKLFERNPKLVFDHIFHTASQ